MSLCRSTARQNPGNVQEYMEKLKKASMRGRLKEAQAAVAAPGRGAPHKGGLDR